MRLLIAILSMIILALPATAETIAERLIKKADGGDVDAQLTVGTDALTGVTQFSDGSSIPKDLKFAGRYLILAAEQNNPLAQLYLGDLFFEQLEGALDYTLAAEAYRRAIAGLERIEAEEAKIAAAQNSKPQNLDGPIGDVLHKLGSIHFQECDPHYISLSDCTMPFNKGGVLKDPGKALQYFKQSAARHRPQAMYAVGVMYELGKGAPQNYETAASWYLQSIEHGHVEAQRPLAELYLQMNDIKHAHMWFNISGNTAERDKLASKMSAEEIAGAQRLASDWTQRRELTLPSFRTGSISK